MRGAILSIGVLCLCLGAWAADTTPAPSPVAYQERPDGTAVEEGTDSFGKRYQRFSVTTADGTMTTIFTEPGDGGTWQTKTEIAEYADGRETREEVFKRRGRGDWELLRKSTRPKGELKSR